MFSNKHVVIAMIVTPILAILAWFAVGQFTGERPHKALVGQSYSLVEKSNCRYASGACDLENEDFKLRITLAGSPAGPRLLLSASHSLEGVLFAVGEPDSESAPTMMRSADDDGREWHLSLGRMPGPRERIRLVARAAGSSWYAEASTLFMEGGVMQP